MNKSIKKKNDIMKYIIVFLIILNIFIFGINKKNYCETIESNPLIDIYKKLDTKHIDIIKNVILKEEEKEWQEKIDEIILKVIPRYKFKMSYFDENDNYIEYKNNYLEDAEKIRKLDRNCLVLEMIIRFLDNNYTNKVIDSDEENEEKYFFEKNLLSDFINDIDEKILTEYFDPIKKMYKMNNYDSSYADSYFRQLDFNPKENNYSNNTFYIATEYRGIFPTPAELKQKYKEEAREIGKLIDTLNFETYKRIEPLFSGVTWLFRYDYNKLVSKSEAYKYLVEAYNYIKEENKFYDKKLDY